MPHSQTLSPGLRIPPGQTQKCSGRTRRSSKRPPWAAKSRFGKNRKRQQNVFFQGCPLGPKKAPKRPPREGRKVVNVSIHTMKVMIPLCRSWPPGSLRTHPCPTRGGLRGPLGSQKALPHFSAFQQFFRSPPVWPLACSQPFLACLKWPNLHYYYSKTDDFAVPPRAVVFTLLGPKYDFWPPLGRPVSSFFGLKLDLGFCK